MLFRCVVVSVVLAAAVGLPAGDLLQGSDSAVVESSLKEVQAPAPFEDLQRAATGDKEEEHEGNDDDKGYYRSKTTKGDDGYKHFDSYHKKGGDKYGYETHSAYGTGKGGKTGGSHHTSGEYSEGDDGNDKGEYHDGEGTQHYTSRAASKKQKKNKDHQPEATDDGEHFYSSYEAEGDHADEHDGGHFEEGDSGHYDEGDSGHYEDDGGHYSEGYSYEGEGDGEAEGETNVRAVIHHGGPAKATSYYVRHY